MIWGPLVSVDWLEKHILDPQVVILDATVVLSAPRFDGDYRAQSGLKRWRKTHIPGSRFADLLGALSDHSRPYHFAVPGARALASALECLGISDDNLVVVYDSDGGFWAARLWWMLRAIGVRAAVLDGGLELWRSTGHKVESEPPTEPIRGRITIREDSRAWTDIETVSDISAGRAPGTLVCALSREVFSGRAITRYVRRGHIPDSVNLPARQLFAPDGRYLDPERLAMLVSQQFRTSERPLVLYCGGGISAAAEALALTLAGETQLSIYDGSLEEWASNPLLPLVTGD